MVRKFAHLLELGDSDIRQEGELLRLREEVVRTIRANRQLEADLDLMDLKIGLLVRNRVTLQVVIAGETKCSCLYTRAHDVPLTANRYSHLL